MRRKIIPYNPKLKQLARRLRNESTYSERLLWKYLKGKQLRGYDFHRQKPLDEYIVDFFCNELMLAIKIDGITHIDKNKEDNSRQNRLESLGVNFLRFDDLYVKTNVQGVLLMIERYIDDFEERHTPNPSQEGN